MEHDIIDTRITKPIALALGLYEAAHCLVRREKRGGLSRIYAGTKHHMAELSVYRPPFLKPQIFLCRADAFSGTLFKTYWDKTTDEVVRGFIEIDVEAWRYPISFGLGQLRHPLHPAAEVRLLDQEGARQRLINAARAVQETLQS